MNAQTLIILGGAGDLATRLLIPGIGEYCARYDADVRLIGVGREEVDYPDLVATSLAGAGVKDAPDSLAADATFLVADATDPEDLKKILAEAGEGRTVLYYALPPAVSVSSIEALQDLDLPAELFFAMEKPYGETAEEADQLDATLLAVTDEEHIVRVDHFLCEAVVTNLSGLVAANGPFRASWSAEHIAAIDIVYDEDLALEGRAEFYDATGATRDMIQSHLLQVLAHVLCVDGRAAPASVLEATTVIEGSARRARYEGYTEEEGVDPARGTETLAQLECAVDLPRWEGVRMLLRSGKALTVDKAVTVHYRSEEGQAPTRLRLPFDDDIFLEVNLPDPGHPEEIERVTLHSGTVPSRLSPYGRVARAVLTGDDSVEVPAGTPQRAWRILEPVLDAFAADDIPLEEYPVGSTVPEGWR